MVLNNYFMLLQDFLRPRLPSSVYKIPILCLLLKQIAYKSGRRTVSNNGSGSGLAPAQNILAVQVWFGFTWAPFSRFRFTQVKYYWFRFIDLKFNCRYLFRPEKKKKKLLILLMITTALIVRVPAPSGYGKNILTFVRGLGSVWVHLSTILRVQVHWNKILLVQVRFGFT